MGIFYYIVIIAILAVMVILMIGLGAFTSGGEFNKKYANKLMRYRIIGHAVAITLILIFVAVRGTIGD